MHLTPALYAHLTNMLSVLANGKLAILMEVGFFTQSLDFHDKKCLLRVDIAFGHWPSQQRTPSEPC